ncbi:pentapeptide repeat-containing protein [Bordetella bronchiseptica]
MKFEIKNRYTGAVLFTADVPDDTKSGLIARVALEQAVKSGANLARANLAGADLAGANLAGANLAGAYLARANLAGARNLPVGTEATSPVEPYQRDTRHAAERNAARAARFRELNPTVPVVEALDAKILSAIENGRGGLEMGAWHTCETTHCRAGWAVHLAGEAGYALEREHGPQYAGRMIYMASVGRAPHFFASNELAMADLREQAAQQTKPVA